MTFLTVLLSASTGIGHPYDYMAHSRGVFVQHRTRMILIPLAAAAAIVIMAVTRRPAKLSPKPGQGR
jgi:hypothetical protein